MEALAIRRTGTIGGCTDGKSLGLARFRNPPTTQMGVHKIPFLISAEGLTRETLQEETAPSRRAAHMANLYYLSRSSKSSLVQPTCMEDFKMANLRITEH